MQHNKKQFIANFFLLENKQKERSIKQAYTLVELIVVIVILGILSTIAFIAFFDYNKQARDSVRISDINMLTKSMEMSKTSAGAYPSPDNQKEMTYKGGVVWQQGSIGDAVIRFLKIISNKPVDPQYKNEYSYSLTASKQEYQIGAISEKEVAIRNPFIENANAGGNDSGLLAYTKGNFDDLFVSSKVGSSCYVVAAPTLMLSSIPESGKLEDAGTDSLVFKGEGNLPPTYRSSLTDVSFTGAVSYKSFLDPSVLLYTGCTVPDDLNAALQFASNTKKAYLGTNFENIGAAREIATTVNADGLVKLGVGYTNYNLFKKGLTGDAFKIDFSTAVLPNFTCAEQPNLSNTNNFTVGNPTDFNQIWVYSDTPGNCTFACENGYAYNQGSKSCVPDVCIGDLGDLNGVMVPGSTQQVGSSWTYSATPGVCTYKCAAGHSYDSDVNKCVPNNCTAGTVTVNSHPYPVPALNHNETKFVTSSDITIEGGKISFEDNFKCSLGVISEIGSETQNPPVCNENYSIDGLGCKADSKVFTCAAKPANTVWNTVSLYTQTWNGNAWMPADSTSSYNTTESFTSCNYICDNGFHTEDSGASCISDMRSCTIVNGLGKQTWNTSTKTWGSCAILSCNSGYVEQGGACVADQCAGVPPQNSVSTATSQTVTKSWVYSTTPGACTFSCDTNYSWNGSNACVADTKTFTCPAKPANTTWNSVGSYTQTWNGVAWLPPNSTTEYNLAASTTSCRYNCSSGYHTEDGGANCISDTRSCTISNGNGTQTWGGSSWGTCAAVSCNSGYTKNGNICEPSNCAASTQIVNGHSYSLTAFNHGSAQSKSTTISITNGNRTYTQIFSCDFGNITPSGAETDSPNCNTNYTWNGGSCVAGTQTFTCANTKPANSMWNTVSSYLQTWNGSSWMPANTSTAYNTTASTTACNYKCNTGYHTENSGTSCVSDTASCTITNGSGQKTWNGSSWGSCIVTSCNSGYVESSNTCIADLCGSTIPVNGTSNATSQTASKNWTYSTTAGQCTFICSPNYTWNGSACIANTKTFTCAAKAANSDWNTVSSYVQTWNGSAWLPADSTTVYNTTASTTSCNYKCSAGYHNESGCISDVRSCTITNGAGSQTWSGTWGTCTVTSCNSGYVQSGNSCVVANCNASTQVVNSHTYSVPAFNNGTTTTVTSVTAISNGSRTYSQTFSCSLGTVTTSGGETNTTNTCNAYYTWNGSVCAADVPAAPTVAGASRCGAGTVTLSATPPASSTIDWYSASSGGSPLASGVTTYSPSVSSTTTYYAESRNTTTGSKSASRTAVTATVSATPVGGTASWTAANVCAGTTMTMNLSGYSGTVKKWQYSYNGGAWVDWGNAGNTSINWPTSSTSNSGYRFQAVIGNGVCSDVSSAPTATSAVDAATVGGTMSATPNPVDSGAATSLNLTGKVGTVQGWEYYYAPTSGPWTAWSIGTPTSYSWGAAPTYYFRALVKNGACPAAYSSQVLVNIYTYSWNVGAYGSCSASCGAGTQSRTVSCLRSDGATVADSYCTTYVGAKPATSQACTGSTCSCSFPYNASYGGYYINCLGNTNMGILKSSGASGFTNGQTGYLYQDYDDGCGGTSTSSYSFTCINGQMHYNYSISGTSFYCF